MKIFPHFLSATLFSLFLLGCTSPRMERELKDFPIGSVYTPQNVFSVDYLSPEIQIVAVLPFSTSTENESLTPEVEMSMVRCLRQEGRFEVVQISEEELYRICGKDRLALHESLPGELISHLIGHFGVNAVMQNEITAFRPYKPMVLGVHARLFDISDGKILWSCDEVFDSGNKKVVMGTRKYAEKQVDQPFPLQSSYSTLISPQRFAAYVASTLYNTLPSRSPEAE